MRILLTTVLFLSIACASYSVGSLLAFEHAPWKWPASGQVALVIVVVFLTAILYGILGINRPDDDMEFDDDRR